jgi:hypothetical protein
VSTIRVFSALLAAVIGCSPAAAEYREFTGTISFQDSSPGGSAKFLPEGVSVSGSGVAWSRNGWSLSGPHRQIRSFAGVKGFTGSLTTAFGSTAGYTQMVFVSGFGPGNTVMQSPCWASAYTGCLTTNTGAPPGSRLHGKMPVRGLAERFIGPGNRVAAFPLTNAKKGLGLGGTVMGISGSEPSVRFGTWETGMVSEMNVIVESHPAKGGPIYGNVTGVGFDTRTTHGMGTVQFVTPIRTVSQPIVCPLPPCAPILGKRGAVVALTLHFAPEPARGVLLLAACGALALLGVSRRRARR